MRKHLLTTLFLSFIVLLAVDGFAQTKAERDKIISKTNVKYRSNGVPAAPFPFEYQQPNGELITIYIKGDGAVHWYQTKDGYTIMQDLNGVYFYTNVDEDKNLIITNIKVNNIDKRTQKEIDFLSNIKTELRYTAEQIEKMKAGFLPYPKGAEKAGSFPTSGTNNLLMILQDFPDAPFTYPRENFDDMMNVTGYNGTGSFRQYHYANSYGQLTMVTAVVGWYTAANNHDYYCDACPGADPNNRYPGFVREAVDNAEAAGVDFSIFDNTGNGKVDGVMVIHQGDGAEMGDNTNIWSHSWSLSARGLQVTYDGVLIDDYTANPETSGGGAMGTIGVLCHEFGHNLGLPDFYDTDYGTGGQGFDLGAWDCMAGGSYNGGGASPAMHNAWSKIDLGWMTATELNTACEYTLNPIFDNPEAYYYNTPTNGEYFLLENRQQIGFDVGIPGHGMLIYHVDENYSGWSSNDVNAVATHQAMDIEEADGTQNDANRDGDIFPGTSNNTSFTDATTPNSKSWANANTNKPLTSIAESGDKIYFDFMGGASSNPSNFTTTTISSTQINLSWTLNAGSDPVMIVVNTSNTFGEPNPGTPYAVSASIPGGGTVIYNTAGTTFNHTGLTDGTIYYYKAWSVATGEIYSCGTSTYIDKTCTILDITETCDNLDVTWESEATTTFAWLQGSETTASPSTGPDTDHSGTGAYMFTEASAPAVVGDIAYLNSPTLDLAVSSTPTLKFYYHMYGSTMGTLSVEVYNGGAWTPLWTISGQQHASGAAAWTEKIIDLSAYKNSFEQVRFKGVRGTDYYGDMAVDDISIYDDFSCTPPTGQASNFGATPDFTTIDLTWDRGNGDNIIVIAKQGGPVDASPIFNTNYTANTAFGSGDDLGGGNFVVYKGPATGVTVTALTEATTYHFALFEYNNTDICFMKPGLTGNSTTITTPPTISNVSPNNFFTDKGASLSITGTNFSTVTSVTIGGVTGTITPINATSMTVDFPAGNYSNNTITVTNPGGSPTSTVTVNKRNIIPVGGGTDFHTTIQSALDGLFAWYGTTLFDAGQLAGTKTIDVYTGTYAEVVTPNVTLSPSATNQLIIQNSSGQSPIINATGNANGIYIGALDNVTVSGFTVYGATNDNIYTEGDNNTISLNKCYGSTTASGIKLSAAANSTVTNNLLYSNSDYGIHLVGSNSVEVDNNTTYENGHNTVPQSGVEIFNYDVESGDYTGWITSGTDPNTWGPYDDAAYANSPTISFMLNQGDATLTYSSVDVTGYDNLTISCYARSDQLSNNQDDLYGEYSFDGTAWTQFFYIKNEHATYVQYPVTGVAPTSTTLYIRFRGRCDAGEWWHVDDIVVYGDETGAGENIGAGLYVESGTGTSVENNIFVAKTGTNYVAMETASGITVTSDYNTYFKNGNDNLVDYSGSTYADLALWTGNGAGANELEGDPLFVDIEEPGYDFHVQSTLGTYTSAKAPIWPPDVATGGTWTIYGSNSPTIDAGNPVDVFSNELEGGGGAIDQGSYGNTPQATKGDGTLPVVWKAHDAKCENGVIQINWATYSEINNDYFTVEKIIDDKFEPIATIDGAGNSSVANTYSYKDVNTANENYYRIKQTDFDGQSDYSPIFNARCTEANRLMEEPFFNVYPNPFSNNVVVQVVRCNANQINIDILNNTGVIVGHNSMSLEDGVNSRITLNTSRLPQGIYLLKISVGGVVQTKKIIKN